MRDDELVTMAVLLALGGLVVAAVAVNALVGFSLRKKTLIVTDIAVLALTAIMLFLTYEVLKDGDGQGYCLSLSANDRGEWVCMDPPPGMTDK